MTITYNITGPRRRELAQTLGKILMLPPVYAGAPTFSYKVGAWIVDKSGNVLLPATATQEIADRVVAILKQKGFTPEGTERDKLSVGLPRSQFTPDALDRLKQMIENKAILFQRAFQTDSLLLDVGPEEIRFPWFTLHDMAGEAAAYTYFVAALGRMARERKRVKNQPYHGNNDKFSMRLFLVQLGLIGPKFKEARKVLLMNLTGNSAWRDGPPTGTREVTHASK